MNKKTILIGLCSMLPLLAGCNSFLDTLPDKRIEITTPQALRELVVSAYPSRSSAPIVEHRTDNVTDNGRAFMNQSVMLKENYFWQDMTDEGNDGSKAFWDIHYSAIATANQVLEIAHNLGNGPEYQSARGEALLCRAFARFRMLNVFAQAYNTQTSATDLGMPAFLEAEKTVGQSHPRLSVKEGYELIDKDIQEAIPLIDDTHYPRGARAYHFTSKAAYAFAAQFYLYYEKWDKALEYANKVLGDNPTEQLRNLKAYSVLNSSSEWANAYASNADPSNLLLLPTISTWSRFYRGINRGFDYMRYAHAMSISNRETLSSPGPWGANLPNISENVRQYTSASHALGFIYKLEEFFEMTDVVARTGYSHTIFRPLTTDRTLFVRAEALTMLKRYDEAARDLSYWYVRNGAPKAVSAQEIANYYNISETEDGLSPDQKRLRLEKLETVSKPLSPRFALEPGMQYNMMQAVLHARRIDGVFEGTRWEDIRRYGIVVKHAVEGQQEPLVLEKYDKRKAVQIPRDIIVAGMQPNP